MPSITFYGATEEVTGSCYLVRGKKITVLVDCGLFQGERFARAKNYEPLPFGCGEVDHVLLTHAHIDHTGRLPKICLEGFTPLEKATGKVRGKAAGEADSLTGFTGKIYATVPTLELTEHLWQDALEIMDIEYQETGRQPLYAPKDIKNAEKFFSPVKYGERVFISDTDYAIFHDAGHILGSAFIELVVDGKKIIFSGDVGNVRPPIIRETETLPEGIDLLVCESTYSNQTHETPAKRKMLLEKTVIESIKNKGTLLIPAFAVERTQEILYEFNRLVGSGAIPAVPIFLDSPLAIRVTEVFKKNPGFYNHDDQLLAAADHDLFNFPGLRLTPTRAKSKEINSIHPPKIIIAGNGMMNGGRIIYHLERYLPDPKNTLLIIGYQAANTTGRKILQGHKWIPLFTRSIPVRARVQAIGGFSAHADQVKLLSWVGEAKKLRQVCLVHGDAENMKIFATKLGQYTKISVNIPKYKETINI